MYVNATLIKLIKIQNQSVEVSVLSVVAIVVVIVLVIVLVIEKPQLIMNINTMLNDFEIIYNSILFLYILYSYLFFGIYILDNVIRNEYLFL